MRRSGGERVTAACAERRGERSAARPPRCGAPVGRPAPSFSPRFMRLRPAPGASRRQGVCPATHSASSRPSTSAAPPRRTEPRAAPPPRAAVVSAARIVGSDAEGVSRERVALLRRAADDHSPRGSGAASPREAGRPTRRRAVGALGEEASPSRPAVAPPLRCLISSQFRRNFAPNARGPSRAHLSAAGPRSASAQASCGTCYKPNFLPSSSFWQALLVRFG